MQEFISNFLGKNYSKVVLYHFSYTIYIFTFSVFPIFHPTVNEL